MSASHGRALRCIFALQLLACAGTASAATETAPTLGGIRIEFLLFTATLLGVALFHHHTLHVALTGLVAITLYAVFVGGFHEGPGVAGLIAHVQSEWVIVANLFALLVGFAALSRHFEDSHVPALLPRLLPNDWTGALALLCIVFVLSSFLDNIAAALIGGTVARAVFRDRVHVGYLAAIVGASNAGGSGSVVGDTTTTMMWIDGVHPLQVLEAYIAAVVAMLIFGVPASLQQHRYSPITRDAPANIVIDWVRVAIVALMLIAAIVVNIVANVRFASISGSFPFIGAAVWVVLLLCAPIRTPAWGELPGAFKGSVFLLSLVLAASMMPVEKLPDASWQTALGLGFVSAVFDNIPLTALALKQGGYDWGYVAYAVGFGGSMIWFGSSAGVALTNMYPEGKNAIAWVKSGWHVAVAYVIGFMVMLAIQGWVPEPKHHAQAAPPHPSMSTQQVTAALA